jgi:16S rRNA (guanine527-N7)-methyltransferase
MFHVKHEGLTSEAAALGLQLTGEQADRLQAFEELLADRGAAAGLVSSGDVARLRERHVLDCLRAAGVVESGDRTAADLGSGGGLPGLVVAIVRPALEVKLIESRTPKTAFLELAVERLGLENVVVRHERVEHASGPFDLAFARAFANPARSWRAAERLLRPGGRLVYFAGASFEPDRVPAGVNVRILTAPPVASMGPLAIMSRQ